MTASFVALSGCDDNAVSTADPTVPTAASSSTSSTAPAPDVSAIPETIDEPYLNAVLAALDEVDGEATRIIKASKRIFPEAADVLNSIYSDEAVLIQTQNWADSIVRDPELGGVRPEPGNRRTTVERIIAASPTCVWLATKRDRSTVNVNPGPTRTTYIAMKPLDPSNDPNDVNRTAWMIVQEGLLSDGSEPPNPCPAS